MSLFIEQEFDNTSMDQTAQKADASRQAVYRHFGSKEDLFSSAIAGKCLTHHLTADDFRQFDCPGTALTTIASRFHELLQTREAVQVYRTCVAQAETHSELASLFFKEFPEKMVGELSNLLSGFHEREFLHIPDPHFAAVQFLMMVHGEVRMRIEPNIEPLPDNEIDRYLKSCVNVFLKAHAA